MNPKHLHTRPDTSVTRAIERLLLAEEDYWTQCRRSKRWRLHAWYAALEARWRVWKRRTEQYHLAMGRVAAQKGLPYSGEEG